MAYGTGTGLANYNTAIGTGGPAFTQGSMPVINAEANPFGFIEVNGIDGVNRYPVAPGAGVILKDSTSDLVFIKARDISGAAIPLRVFRAIDVTEEFTKNEEPVTRKEFMQLQNSIGEVKSMLEFLTAPVVKEDPNV